MNKIFKFFARHFYDNKITRIYVFIFLCITTLFVVSFLVTHNIASNAIEENYDNENDIDSLVEVIDEIISDIDSHIKLLTNNPTLSEFMSSDYAYERIAINNEFSAVLNSIQDVDSNIASFSFYDINNQLVKSYGSIYSDQSKQSELVYEDTWGAVAVNDFGNTYFSVIFPIYDINKKYEYLGYGFILVDSKSIRDLLNIYHVYDSSFLSLINESKNEVLSVGTNLKELNNNEFFEDEFLIDGRTISSANWELIKISEVSQVPTQLNLMQEINIITYSIVLAVLVMLGSLMYRSIIRPIKNQMKYIEAHHYYPNEKISVKYQNELRQMIFSTNDMLKSIDELSAEKAESQDRYYKSEIERHKTEMLAYRNQTNPHFLYNTFECIRGMALNFGIMEIASITEALSNLYIYSVKGGGYAKISEELKYSHEYAKIIDYRFMGKHKISFEYDEELLECVLPKMIIQPLLENAVFHGLENKITPGNIDVSIKNYDKYHFTVCVEDDGVGIRKERLLELNSYRYDNKSESEVISSEKGIGIENILYRLYLFYGKSVPFEITSEEGKGTKITIILKKKIN